MNPKQKKIETLLSKNKDFSFDEIMLCAEQVREDGNIFYITLSGKRSLDMPRYIVQIGFPKNTEKMIKAEGRVLKEACLSVLREYFAAKPNLGF